MPALDRLPLWLDLSRSRGIVRRYFVVNGFDGALTMLGLVIAFHLSGTEDLDLVAGACVGAALALGISGATSAYLSETAERRRALSDLQDAMLSDLSGSLHGSATRAVPWLIALVNGAAPLAVSLFVVAPVLLARSDVALPFPALPTAIVLGFVCIFGLGAFLGRVAGTAWWWSGVKAVVIGLITAALILLINR